MPLVKQMPQESSGILGDGKGCPSRVAASRRSLEAMSGGLEDRGRKTLQLGKQMYNYVKIKVSAIFENNIGRDTEIRKEGKTKMCLIASERARNFLEGKISFSKVVPPG